MMAMIKPEGPDLCHNLAARRNARGLTRLYDRHLAPSGLSVSQFSILTLIDTQDAISIAGLAGRLVMERTTLLRALKPLQDAGLIHRQAMPSSTAHSLHLTDGGISKIRAAAPLWRAAQAAYEESVGHDRANELRDAVNAIDFSSDDRS